MKKGTIPSVCIAIILSLTACGNGLSSKNYDDLLNEKSELATDYATLKSEYDVLNEKYLDELDKNEKFVSEKIPLDFASPWAKSSFGDSTSCAIDDKSHLFVNIPTNYTANDALKMFDDIKKSLSTWVLIDSPNSNTSYYSYVTFTFYDNYQNGIVSYTFDNRNKKMNLKTIMGDLTQTDELVAGMSNK